MASNVELDLGGYSLLANPANAAISTGIRVGSNEVVANEVRIRNGRISDFQTGISGNSTSNRLLLEFLEIASPSTGVTTVIKGVHVRACSFVLTAATGVGLRMTASGAGIFSDVVESCTFTATVTGVAATQIGLHVNGGGAPAAIRECQFLALGQGILGNNQTTIANNIFRDCLVTHTLATAVGFN